MDPSTTPPTGALEPGTRLDVTIERAAALGRGVARVEGLTLLVERGVPGEQVTVAVERAFPRYALARVEQVLRPAQARVEPPCAHFAECGGCAWQHVDYATQLGIKRAVLAEQFERIGGLSVPEGWALVPAPAPLGYRDKVEFVPHAVDGRYVPAYHGLDGQTRVAIEHCLLAPEPMTRLARAVLEALPAVGALPPPGTGGPPALQRLTVQATTLDAATNAAQTPALAVLLHLRAPRGMSEGHLRRAWRHAMPALRQRLEQGGTPAAALAIQFPARMGRGGARRGGPTVEVAWGPQRLHKRVHGRTYRVPQAAFFQVHPELAGALVAHVVEQVTGALAAWQAPLVPGPVLDLFGGVGLFSLPLAERGLRVVCVDAEREGLRAGEETARGLGLHDCVFHRADLERPEAWTRLRESFGRPAAIVCDPPRRGLSAALTGALAALPADQSPAALVYVSCDGGTFARDAARLAPTWRLQALRAFDLFPQTHHLEVVGTFVRA